MPHSQFAEPIGTARGVMFDLDGTLILSNRELGQYKVLPGAVETLEALRHRGIPYLALTNGSAYPASRQAPRLREIGLPIPDENLFTPNSVAGGVFRNRGVERVLVLGTEGVAEALRGEGMNTIMAGDEGAASADAVYVAWHPNCTMDDIHAACEAVLRGAAFFTASDVPFFATQSGRSFGYSCAIGGAVARVTGVEPEVTGKPSLHAMEFVAAQLGLAMHEVAVIGDDPKVETEMARLGGAIGIGVTTGTTSLDEWAAQPAERAPHRVIDHIDAILDMGLLV
ncbi:HAD hydrolase-like protein [Altererythrobacter sp. CC-YST694]|uniref:HAD-IIA family hydrolase n=1 Tax=Altererythrobacter sp. CC-YST694 TaxID=2755038 RepID=UPI001D01E684|nr:HAD hydrolase-like protein [Altererythrobacter sp. CC-YST694]MCB5426042.1 HAD hydrolase-like protein [Altererythrobacter sp. CC-YST694]